MKHIKITLWLITSLCVWLQPANAHSVPTTDIIDYKYIQPQFAPVLGLDVDFIHEHIKIHHTGHKLDQKTANEINDLLLNLQETMHGNLNHPAIKSSIVHDLHQLAGLIGMDVSNHDVMTKFKNDFSSSMDKLIKGIIPNLDTTRLNQLNHDLGLEGNGIDYIVPKYHNGHKIDGEFTTINTYLLSAINKQYNKYNTAQRKFNEHQRQLQISQTYIMGFEQKLVKQIQEIESLDKSYAIHNLGLNEAEKIELKEDESQFDSLHQVALHQLGNVYLIQGELDSALQHFDKYITHYEQTLGDKANDEERNLYHIFIGSKGKALFDQEKFLDAQQEFTKIIDYYNDNQKGLDHVCVTSIYFNALCFFRQEDYRPALYFLDMLVSLYQENADNVDEIYYETVFCKVSILLRLNDIDNSLAQLNKSIEFCSTLKEPNKDIIEEFQNFKKHIVDSVNKSAGNA